MSKKTSTNLLDVESVTLFIGDALPTLFGDVDSGGLVVPSSLSAFREVCNSRWFPVGAPFPSSCRRKISPISLLEQTSMGVLPLEFDCCGLAP